FVFFYSYSYHRDLHSFPTRRSSDLFLLRPRVELPQQHVPRGPRGCRGRRFVQVPMASSASTHDRCIRLTAEVRVGPGRVTLSMRDRKSTRLNSSHSQISYAVFCLKK